MSNFIHIFEEKNVFKKINLFILLYNMVLVLPYIDLNPPWVYMRSPSKNAFYTKTINRYIL